MPGPVPARTAEQRAAAQARAVAVRAARAQLKAGLKNGSTSLAAVLDRTDDPVVGKMKVTALLEALPRVGKTTAADLMFDLQIAPSRRVGGLGSRQRADLLQRFPA
ncbi:integration host factor, actinobacterial type [Tsukamurella soli]|uniref:Integration host factor, actinobacterial type n=1 Tax=Tsukamurella soli TaxID=644556 RepID=A0ABP8KI53_9ACTN